MVKRPSLGRRKIAIEKIEREDSRQVTFSKRRAGLFKKASELCILCGAEIAIIVYSPAGKAFSFGHPSVENIINCFLTQNSSFDHSSPSLVDGHRGANVRDLNRQYTELMNQLEMEKKKTEKYIQMKKSIQHPWWQAPIENMSLNQLELLRSSMEELKKDVSSRADELLIHTSLQTFHPMNPMNSTIHNPFESKEVANNANIVPYGCGYGFGGHGGIY